MGCGHRLICEFSTAINQGQLRTRSIGTSWRHIVSLYHNRHRLHTSSNHRRLPGKQQSTKRLLHHLTFSQPRSSWTRRASLSSRAIRDRRVSGSDRVRARRYKWWAYYFTSASRKIHCSLGRVLRRTGEDAQCCTVSRSDSNLEGAHGIGKGKAIPRGEMRGVDSRSAISGIYDARGDLTFFESTAIFLMHSDGLGAFWSGTAFLIGAELLGDRNHDILGHLLRIGLEEELPSGR